MIRRLLVYDERRSTQAQRQHCERKGIVDSDFRGIASSDFRCYGDHGDIVVQRARSTQFGCRSFRGPTNRNKLPQDLRSTDTWEQFQRRLKGWLFGCAYGRRRVRWTLTEGVPYKWTYLLTYLLL